MSTQAPARNVGFLSEPKLSEHMQGVRLGYLDIVRIVARWKERSPAEAHEHAMFFYALDATGAA